MSIECMHTDICINNQFHRANKTMTATWIDEPREHVELDLSRNTAMALSGISTGVIVMIITSASDQGYCRGSRLVLVVLSRSEPLDRMTAL